MKQEEKQLLIKDICARLPFGLKLNFYSRATNENVLCTLLGVEPDGDKPIIAKTDNGAFTFTQDHVKPYLRLMSSMTEEELNECVCQSGIKDIECPNWQDIPKEKQFEARLNHAIAVFLTDSNNVDWLNAHHFDYRGLIERGLALEAPEGMYETKTE